MKLDDHVASDHASLVIAGVGLIFCGWFVGVLACGGSSVADSCMPLLSALLLCALGTLLD